MSEHSGAAISGDLPLVARSSAGRGNWLARVAGVVVLSASLVGIYGRAMDRPFFFDDLPTIVTNPSIRQLWPLWGEESGPLNPEPGLPTSARPLVNLTLAANYHWGGLDPAGYRAFDLALHLLSALLLWWIVAHTLRLEHFQGHFERAADLLGFCAALVWAVHPLASEAVVYVTQRTELMMALFYLATLAASMRYWEAGSPGARGAWLVVAMGACLLGAFSKEMIASAPAVVLLFERTLIARSFRAALRRSWPLYLGLATSWLVLAAINLEGARTPLSGFGLGVSASTWWMTQCEVFFQYLKLAFWPWPLVIHYEIPYLESVAQAWPWLLAGGLFGVVTLWLVWRHSSVGLALLSVVAILSPTLVVPLVGETAVERRMYLPLAAIVALVVPAIYLLLSRFVGRYAWPAQTLACAAMAGGLSLVTIARLGAFESEFSLWQDAILHQPENPLVQVNLALQLNEAGQRGEAMRHLLEAVRLKPDWYFGHYNLARAYEEAGQSGEAIEHYHQALRLKPDHAPSHNNLGRLLSDFGRYDAAIEHFELALASMPKLSAAHNNLAVAQLKSGKVSAAIEHFEQALRLRRSIEGYTNLAAAYALAGRTADAIEAAEIAAYLAKEEGQPALADEIETAIDQYRSQMAPGP